MNNGRAILKLSGKILSHGLGEGKVFIYHDTLEHFDQFYNIVDNFQIEDERNRLNQAIIKISGDLNILADRVETEIDSDFAGVFQSHVAIVQDTTLSDEIKKEIADELVSAGSAARTVLRRWEHRFSSMEDDTSRQKADDIRDLTRRLVSALAGIHAHVLNDFPSDGVLVARRLLPSDTIFLASRSASAVLLEEGGMGSHAALFAREIGLPCISGIKNLLSIVRPDNYAQVDAETGTIIINPDAKQQRRFLKKSRQQKLIRVKAQSRALKPVRTKDGTHITVFANVGCANDTMRAIENGADGIGLYRIEKAYMGFQEPPNTVKLLDVLNKTLGPARNLPVYVRLLDIGADKTLPFLELKKEPNPSLGLRGIRFLKEYPNLLQTQIDALLQLSIHFNLHILVPMVTLPGDILLVKKLLNDSAIRINVTRMPKLGAMIETPAAALAVSEIAKHVDFLSFGTNDLTQYTFAADRENGAVDLYFNDTHDAIFRLMSIVHEDVPESPLSICGELAGNSEYTSRVLNCGITSLSVAPLSIPTIKSAVRKTTL
ncbi:MAG: phosphoenolpyruvate--protein phosphotransferase [Spirochaetia bacterium]|jgi:phosphoenolpyruvate-protein phosphotransferase|nr:phosphoenolpyruvate--protein phosphotransferase [Spirochaetia bacterium]